MTRKKSIDYPNLGLRAACCRFSDSQPAANPGQQAGSGKAAASCTQSKSKNKIDVLLPISYLTHNMDELPNDEKCAKGTQHWPHALPHRLSQSGVYFVTARCADGRHLLESDGLKDWFQETLLRVVSEAGWTLEAWAILSNHYHFIGHSPKGNEGSESLRMMIRKLHSLTTQELNRRENQVGRSRLWQNYRETCLTHQHSYLARLHYVHQNAVHHKLVAVGSDWKWCSAAQFKEAVTPAWLRTITSFRYDQIAAKDGD